MGYGKGIGPNCLYYRGLHCSPSLAMDLRGRIRTSEHLTLRVLKQALHEGGCRLQIASTGDPILVVAKAAQRPNTIVSRISIPLTDFRDPGPLLESNSQTACKASSLPRKYHRSLAYNRPFADHSWWTSVARRRSGRGISLYL